MSPARRLSGSVVSTTSLGAGPHRLRLVVKKRSAYVEGFGVMR